MPTESAKSKQRLPIGDQLHVDFKVAAIHAGKTLFDATQEAIAEWVRKQEKTKRRAK